MVSKNITRIITGTLITFLLMGCKFPSDTEGQLRQLLTSAQSLVESAQTQTIQTNVSPVLTTDSAAQSTADVTFLDGDSRKILNVAPGEIDVVILSMHRTDDLIKKVGVMELLIESTKEVPLEKLFKPGSIRLVKNGYEIGAVAPYTVTVKGSKIYITFYYRWFGETYSPYSTTDSKPIMVVATMSPSATPQLNTKFVMSKVQVGEIDSTSEIKEVKGPDLQVSPNPSPAVASVSPLYIPTYESWDSSQKEIGRFQVSCPLTEKESPCHMQTIRLSTVGSGLVFINSSSESTQAELYGQANFQYAPFVIPAGMMYEYTIYSTGQGGYLNINTLEFVVDGKRLIPNIIGGQNCSNILADLSICPKG